MRVLHIEASPRRERSGSSRIAAEFLKQVSGLNAELEVDHLDVWAEVLPEFDGAALDARYARLAGKPWNSDQQEAWDRIVAMVERVDRADAILVSTPMWNLGIPYRLKHFIDLVTQPGLSFRFEQGAGFTPLLRARPVAAIVTSSGDFSTGESYGRPDLVGVYMQAAFRFIGLDNMNVVRVAPTVGPSEGIEAGEAQARTQLALLAGDFAGKEASALLAAL
jgi:FMN-dependent NADH-azoreductase